MSMCIYMYVYMCMFVCNLSLLHSKKDSEMPKLICLLIWLYSSIANISLWDVRVFRIFIVTFI